MATGDIIWFDEAMSKDYTAGWLTTNDIKCAVLDNTATPIAAFVTPALGDFTEVTAAGTYVAGGTSLGNWGAINSQTAGVGLVDSGTNPTFAADPANDTDAFWGLLYNATFAGDLAFAFVELGGPVDMVAGSLTITWSVSGIATTTKA